MNLPTRHFRVVAAFILVANGFAAEPIPSPDELPRIPATEPERALETFELNPELRLELVAAEPLVVDPVAMDFDLDGSLYVVEMRGYSERRDAALGRVRRLIDVNDDGVFDESHVFADELSWPTAILCANDGVYIGATPNIYFLKDVDGDGISDQRETVFTGFGPQTGRLNVQGMLNSFRRTLDQRIHGAASSSGGLIKSRLEPDAPTVNLAGSDFSFDPAGLDLRAETGGSQHGLTFDRWGRKFLCHNSDHIQAALFERRHIARNPNARFPRGVVSIGVEGPAAEVFRISPDEPWRIVRTRWRVAGAVGGPVEGGGRVSGYFTSATGITIYEGDALPGQYQGAAFIGDVGSNLIHRKIVDTTTLPPSARRHPSERNSEFLASTDNWFRPVQLGEGPDGGLYILDMYRETIEHPWSIPESIKSHLDLNSGASRGRIYRIVSKDFQRSPTIDWTTAPQSQVIAGLASPNRWTRQACARVIYESKESFPLERFYEETESPMARIRILYLLESKNQLTEQRLLSAFGDSHEEVRRHAVRMAENWSQASTVARQLAATVSDPALGVRYQLAFSAGSLPETLRLATLHNLAISDGDNPWMRLAIQSSSAGREWDLFRRVSRNPNNPFASELASTLGADSTNGRLEREEVQTILGSGDLWDRLPLALAFLRGASNTKKESKVVELASSLSALDQLCDDEPPNLDLEIDLAGYLRWRPNALSNEWLARAVADHEDSEFILVAGEGLLSRSVPALTRIVVDQLNRMDMENRSKLIDIVTTTKLGSLELLDSIDRGTVALDMLRAEHVRKLRSNSDSRVQTKTQRVFGKLPDHDSQSRINEYFPALRIKGKPDSGAAIYKQRCAHCHAYQGVGARLAPSIESMSSMPKESLLSHIIDPSREAQPKYYRVTIVTTEGATYSGALHRIDTESVTIMGPADVETTISKDSISEKRTEQVSVMPVGLESGLSHSQMADLLAFIAGD